MKNEISFYAPVTIEKGRIDNEVIDVKMHMVISDPSEDFDKDKITPDMLDVNPLEKSGRVFYEHKPTPDKIIGNVLGVFQIGDKTELVANILAKAGTEQYKVAKSTLDLEENTRLHNERYPNHKKIFGCSIDGFGIRDALGKLIKVVVTDIALTTKPKNFNTLATVMKSFAAGYSVNPSEMSGSEAGRKEHLQGKSKNLNIEVTKMKFDNKAACKKYLIEKCFMSEEQAESKANEWEEAQTKASARSSAITKSIGDIDAAIDAIQKNIVDEKAVDAKIVSIGKSLQEATTITGANNEPDATAFLKSIGDSNVDVMKVVNANSKENGKIAVVQLGSMKSIFEVLKSLSDELSDLRAATFTDANNTELLTRKLDEVEKGLTTDPAILEKLRQENEEKNRGGEKKYTPIEVMTAFEKSISAATDTTTRDNLSIARTQFEIGGKNYEKIDKSIQGIIAAHLPAKS